MQMHTRVAHSHRYFLRTIRRRRPPWVSRAHTPVEIAALVLCLGGIKLSVFHSRARPSRGPEKATPEIDNVDT